MASEEVVRQMMDSLRRVVQALRTSHRAAGSFKLTGAQLWVLNLLGESEAPLSVRDIAAGTRTDPSTVSVVLSRLERRGLVTRKRSAKDSRRLEIRLTKRGHAVNANAPSPVAQAKLIDALERLSNRDATKFAALLAHIVEAMGVADEPVRMIFDDQINRRPRRSR